MSAPHSIFVQTDATPTTYELNHDTHINNNGILQHDHYYPSGNSAASSTNTILNGMNIIVVRSIAGTGTSRSVSFFVNGHLKQTVTATEEYTGSGTPTLSYIAGFPPVSSGNDRVRNMGDTKLYALAVWDSSLNDEDCKTLFRNYYTTLTPLLSNPTPENAGQVVTVNSAGDDLEYSGHLKELECEQTIIRTAQELSEYETWIDLASHNSSYSSSFNTEVTVNVSQNSKVLINLQSGFGEAGGNGFVCVRLGKKVNGNIIWGSSTGFNAFRNDYLTDPKGDNGYSNKQEYSTSYNKANRIESWDFIYITNHVRLEVISPSYIDTDPTNGLTGTHNVTYFMRVRIEHPTSGTFYINRDGSSITDTDDNRNQCATILSATELGSGAITSFKQEQALAGAGGTAAFTAYGLYGNNATDVIDDEINYNTNIYGHYHNSGTTITKLPNNDITQDIAINLPNPTTPVGLSYEFTTPQIVTKYRIWMHGDGTIVESIQKTPKNGNSEHL